MLFSFVMENQRILVQINLPFSFRDEHRRATLKYLAERKAMSRADWFIAFEAFALLRQAKACLGSRVQTFLEIYNDVVENKYSDDFIKRLLQASDIPQEAARLRKDIAKKVLRELTELGWFGPHTKDSRFLLAYCLFWWYSFTKGYAFEIEIFTDLKRTGVTFNAHNLLVREERFSKFNLFILGFCGDIKTSTYFLFLRQQASAAADFYITRLFSRKRRWMLVTFLKEMMWNVINGETQFCRFDELPDVLPQPGKIQVGELTFIVVDYDVWKRKVIEKQSTERGE